MPTRESIPLVPRHRVAGHAHGTLRSTRRGVGGDVVGSRPYRPGDDVRQIDRLASARLSAMLDRDEFVVRERLAEESTYVVVLEDAGPSMRLFPAGFPWLSKPAAVTELGRLLQLSAGRARCHFRWQRQPDGLAGGLEQLLHRRLGSGSFVFLVSDFLRPLPSDLLAAAAERRWDLVPCVLQDSIWEQSFPDVAGVVLPLADPDTARVRPTRLTRRECASRRLANEARFASILERARDLDLDSLVVASHDPDDVYHRFLEWAETRRIVAGRRR